MNWTETPHNLRFEHRSRPLAGRPIAIAATVAGFALLWLIVPAGILFWLLLLLVLLLAWVATYGARKALSILVKALSRLEEQL